MNRLYAKLLVVAAGMMAGHPTLAQDRCSAEETDGLRNAHMVMLSRKESAGSDAYVNGVLVSSDGLILTVTSLLYPFNMDMWKDFRTTGAPRLWIAAGTNRAKRTFEAPGQIVGFDPWRDLLLVKIPAEAVEGMSPAPLYFDRVSEESHLCYSSFVDSSETGGGDVELLMGNRSMGTWEAVEKPALIQSEEPGSGVFVKNDNEDWFLYGVLSDAQSSGDSPPRIINAAFADTLLGYLIYPPQARITKELCNLRAEQIDWRYSIVDSKNVDRLSKDSRLLIRITHSGLPSTVTLKHALVTWKVFGQKGDKVQSQQDSTEIVSTDFPYAAVQLGDLRSKPLSATDFRQGENDLEFTEVLDIARRADFRSVRQVHLTITSAIQNPECPEDETDVLRNIVIDLTR